MGAGADCVGAGCVESETGAGEVIVASEPAPAVGSLDPYPSPAQPANPTMPENAASRNSERVLLFIIMTFLLK